MSKSDDLLVKSQDEFGRSFSSSHVTGGRNTRMKNERLSSQDADNYGRVNFGTNPWPNKGVVIHGIVARIETFGAFVDFVVDDRGQPRNFRGLVHISQLAQYRIHTVDEVVKLNQHVFAVVLEVEGPNRFRLSMRGVDQNTGMVIEDLSTFLDIKGGDRSGSRMDDDRRSLQRQELLRKQATSWKSRPSNWEHMRILWSRSPSPPVAPENHLTKQKEKENSGSSSAHSSEDESLSQSSSSSISTSSEENRRRRRRRDKRRSKRRKHGKRKRYRSPSTSSSSSEDRDSSDVDSKRLKPKMKRKEENITKPELMQEIDEQDFKDAKEFKKAVQGAQLESDEDDNMGPMPLPQSNAAENNNSSNATYGKALLPGEGQAIAAFVQQNLRIPRRGEIGYSGDDIERYEKSGFVMSGSRHTRMNAVRIRKENQIYSAEEQRALALITMEENQQKEAQLMQDFRTMLKEKQANRQKLERSGNGD